MRNLLFFVILSLSIVACDKGVNATVDASPVNVNTSVVESVDASSDVSLTTEQTQAQAVTVEPDVVDGE